MIPPRYPDAQRGQRIRKLLALEISRIVEDLEVRRDFLLDMWSAHRKRQPFLDTVFSRWETLGFPMLAELEPEEVVIIDTFFRELDEFRLYISFTQDMPTTLGERYDWILERIAGYGQLALDALGGAPQRPLIDFDDEAEDEAAALLAFPVERARARERADDPLVEEPEAEGSEGSVREGSESAEQGPAEVEPESADPADSPQAEDDAPIDADP